MTGDQQLYRGYIIEDETNPPSGPIKAGGWSWWPEDYDGPEDPRRSGASRTLAEAKHDIDEALDHWSFYSLDEIDPRKLTRPQLVRAECTECDGSGEGSEPGITCGTCDGSGRCSYVVDVCGSCGGEGERWRDSPFYCEDCGGDHLEIVREDYEEAFAEAMERVESAEEERRRQGAERQERWQAAARKRLDELEATP